MFASAAFTDQADIKNTEAVDTLVALNVIEGFDDGSFRPAGNVTRGQMSKMIYTIRSGGNTDASSYETMATSFTDLSGDAWSANYVKYCQTMGIIAGKSNTIFNPKGNVTVAETAKMALVTMGYRADRAELTGTQWMINTLNLANDNGLLDGVTTGVNSPATRDDAARILFNMIEADAVIWSNDKEDFIKDTFTTGTKTYNPTVGEKYLGLQSAISVLSTVTKDDGKSTYTLVLASPLDDASTGSETRFTKVTADYTAYKNMKVKVLYKGSDEVYGVYPLLEDNTTLTSVLGDFEKDGSKLKYNSVKYSVANAADGEVRMDDSAVASPMTATIAEWVDTNNKGLAKAFGAKAISNNDSSKINLLDIQSFAVGKVTYKGTDYVNVSERNESTLTSYAFSRLDEDNATYPSDLVKDDYVAVTDPANTAEDKYGLTKLDKVTGKITSTKNSGKDDYQVMIDGNWYEMAMDTPNETIALNDTVTVVVKDGYIVYIDDASAASSDVALVIEIGSTGGVGSTWQADILFPDNKREVVTLNSNTGYNGGAPTDVNTPFLATYTSSSGKYKVEAVTGTATTTNVSGYDAFATAATNNVDSNKMVNGDIKYINTNATVFVKYTSSGENAYNVVTGSTMRAWNSGRTFSSAALAKKSNGLNYASVVFADMGAGTLPGGDATYAYLFGSTATSDGDTDYIEYTAWNGTENVTLKVEGTTAFAEGTLVEYTINSEGIADLTNETGIGDWTTVGAITGYDYDADKMEGTVIVNGITYEIDTEDEAYVLFVDTNDGSGANGSMQEAAEVSGSTNLIVNAAVKDFGSGKIVIVVDATNELDYTLFTNTDLSAGIPV